MGTSSDRPRLGGYLIEHAPDEMSVRWELSQELHELADGGFRQRLKGYRLRASMAWNDGWIRQVDLTNLATIANDTSASLSFRPRELTPSSATGHTYEVIWTNKLDFQFWKGNYGTYQGTIELVSPSVTSVVGELP